MKVNCPQCNTEYEVDESMRGQKFNCTQDGCPGILAIPGGKNILKVNPEGFDILDRMKSAFQKQIVCLISAVIALCIMFLFGWGWFKANSSSIHASIEEFAYWNKCYDTKVDLSACRRKCESLQRESKSLQIEYTETKNHLDKQELEYKKLNARYEESKATLSAAQARLESAQKRLSSTVRGLNTASAEKGSLPEQYRNKLTEHEEISSTLSRIQNLKNQYKKEQESLESRKTRLASKLEIAARNLEICKKALATSASEIEDAKEKYIAARAEARSTPKKRRVLSVGATPMSSNSKDQYDENALKREQAALNEYEGLKIAHKQEEEKFSRAQSYYLEIKSQYERSLQREQEFENSLKTLEVKEKEFQRKYEKSESELQQAKAQLETSESSIFELENKYREEQSTIRNFQNLVTQAIYQRKALEEDLEDAKYQKERTAEKYKTFGEELNRLAREHKEATEELDSLETKLRDYDERCELARKEKHKYLNRIKVFRNLFFISLGTFIALLLLFLIFHLIFIYQGWRIIPRETAVTTPKKAIWLNFVPGLFPFWQWVTYFELGKAYSDLSGRRANKVFALIVSVMNFLGVWMISLPWIAIILVMQGELLRSAEIIVNNQTGEE